MKLGDSVFQNYSGIHRFGKVVEVKKILMVMTGSGLK